MPFFTWVSYCRTLLFGMPTLYIAAPRALSPPITAALSSAPTIQTTSGPATSTVPMPGNQKNAEPNSIPQKPPQKAPSLPQYFIRSPVV